MAQTMISKPYTIRELGSVDIDPIKALVNRLSETVWTKEDDRKENNFFCFHHTRHIIFRFIEDHQDHQGFYSNPIWSVWKQELLPIMEQVAHHYDYSHPTYPKVMLARLTAGYRIDRHKDVARSNLYTHKIHIPLLTNPQVKFVVRDSVHYLMEGKAYEVNNIVSHAVDNSGKTDRIHLIFEVYDEAQQ